MPSAILPPSMPRKITKFTNCRLVKDDKLVEQDLWVSAATGKILHGQEAFYSQQIVPDRVVDLGGRIVSAGLIDVQLNGAFGFNFSVVPDDLSTYPKTLRRVNKSLIATGITSYLPTLTSQKSEVYHQVLPYLGPSGQHRLPEDGSESLGAHCEGPFLSPTKNGIHTAEVLRAATTFADLEACYNASNLTSTAGADAQDSRPANIKMITVAPEIGGMTSLIPQLCAHGIITSIGHSEATHEEAASAVTAGATMITHLFNAMRPLHHRNPGIFGVLGARPAHGDAAQRPYFGIIADGVHLHPTSIALAYGMHAAGFMLVTDAMHLVGLPDGVYDWSSPTANVADGPAPKRILKRGPRLTLEGTDTIAGSSITLLECVNNFVRWTGLAVEVALRTVTTAPAAMLGLAGVKGCLDEGADADLCVFSRAGEGEDAGELVLDQVWKFGELVFDRS